jgi:hypothetical protein
MPPRWLSLVIVTFWLGTTGWLVWHDLWPRYRPGNPPPFTIDLTEEAQKEYKIPWTVTQVAAGGKEVPCFNATTSVRYHERDDSFELHAAFKPVFKGGGVVRGLELKRMASSYRITREGDLLGLDVELDLGILDGHISGEVQGGTFTPRYRFNLPTGGTSEGKLPEVKLTARGSMLQPLHPVHRIDGLRPGQSWRMPYMNPVADSLKSLPLLGGGDVGERYLNARVLPEAQPYTYQRHQTTCLVVEYTGDDLKASTWVEESSGKVLCQKADFEGAEWIMRRD